MIRLKRMETMCKGKGKGMVLYSAVSSPLDRSKRFTLSSPGRPVHSDTVLGFSWKHSSHAAIAQRLFTHIFTTVYSHGVDTSCDQSRLCLFLSGRYHRSNEPLCSFLSVQARYQANGQVIYRIYRYGNGGLRNAMIRLAGIV